MTLAVVLNSRAGYLRRHGPEAAAAETRAWFRAAGADAQIAVAGPGELESLVKQAIAAWPDGVVIGGGDGSVSTAARLLVDRDLPLGILPLGTVNLLARTLGVPAAPAQAVRVLAAGSVRRIDVAEVNGHVFLNNAVIGLYPSLARVRERIRALGWPSQLWRTGRALVSALRHHEGLAVDLEVAGGACRRLKTFALAVSNNPYHPDQDVLFGGRGLAEGSLGVYVARHRTWLGLCRLAVEILSRTWRDDPCLERFTAETATVAARRRRLTVAVDGEVVRMVPPLHYRSRPQALPVLVPPATPGAGGKPPP